VEFTAGSTIVAHEFGGCCGSGVSMKISSRILFYRHVNGVYPRCFFWNNLDFPSINNVFTSTLTPRKEKSNPNAFERKGKKKY
jgi:hypothetical protein